jgi:hypothetical protein
MKLALTEKLLREGRGEKMSDSFDSPRFAMLPGLISCLAPEFWATILAPALASTSDRASAGWTYDVQRIEEIRQMTSPMDSGTLK